MKFYADLTTNAYIDARGDDVAAPANSYQVACPPTIAGVDQQLNPIQTWDVNSLAWIPIVSANPDAIGFLIALAFDICQGNSPWEMMQFFHIFEFQGTAQNVDVDQLRRILYWRIKQDSAAVAKWLTPTYQARLEAIGAAYGVPFV